MNFTELLASVAPASGDGRAATVTENWMQGRTAYGGLTAALCLEAATHLSAGLPVRAVQVAFVGPVNGTVDLQAGSAAPGQEHGFHLRSHDRR